MALIEGTSGDNTLAGTIDEDTILGLGGDDVIAGGAGADLLYGDSTLSGLAEPTALYTFDSLLLFEGYNSGTGGSDYDLLNLTLVDIAATGLIGPHGGDNLLGEGTGFPVGAFFSDTWPADAFAADGSGSFTMWAAYTEGALSGSSAAFDAIASWGGVLQLGYRQAAGDWFLELRYTGSDGPQTLSAAIPDVNDGQFHHVGLTFDANDVATLYFDGVQVGQSASGFLDFNARDGGLAFRLSPFTDGDLLENTRLDDVAYWKGTTLTADEIAAIHAAGTGYGGGLDLAGSLGNPGADTIDGGDGDDSIFGADGNDTLSGDAGADFLQGDGGNDMLFGGLDGDSIDGGVGADLLYGGNGDDVLLDPDLATRADGGIGNDYLGIVHTDAGGSFDYVAGGVNDDIIVLRMEELATTGAVDGDAPGSIGLPFDGDDEIYIAGSYDTLTSRLGGGDDLYIGGGSGYDDLAGSAAGARTDIVQGGAGNDEIAGWAGDDLIHGDDSAGTTSGADTLWGGGGGDTIFGGAGADIIYGETGDDALYGGDGADWLHYYVGHAEGNGGPGDGTDRYFGGAGEDNLILTSARDAVSGDLVGAVGPAQWEVLADTGPGGGADGDTATDYLVRIYESDGITPQGAVFFTGGEFTTLYVQSGIINLGGTLVPSYTILEWNGSGFS